MTMLEASPAITPSRQRVLDAIAHKQPDRVPVDFGSTAVTGIHVCCVAALRDHYGLEKRPVKVHEPFQMLGLLDEDLKQALGIDVEGVFRRRTMFGFENKDWKPWTFNGLEVLVPGHVQHDGGREGRYADLSRGRPARPSRAGECPGVSFLRRDHPPEAPRSPIT